MPVRQISLIVLLFALVLSAGAVVSSPITPGPAMQQDATPTPAATTTHTVQRGDTLYRIAIRYNTTIGELLALNPELTNRNVIYVGQQLVVPAPAGTVPPEAAATPEPTAAPASPDDITQAAPQPDTAFAFGVQADLIGQEPEGIINAVDQLGTAWVKQHIFWRDFEPVEGEIDFETLDGLIDTLEQAGVNILLTISYAPAWARTLPANEDPENGPPDNFADYGAFMQALAERYQGRVQAYQVWNEPNLRNRWKSPAHPIGALSYIQLLRHGYDAIKAVDPDAMVITAGLAPTGFNDAYNAQVGELRVNAVDDRVFLTELYANGVSNYADGIGAHPMGWANPPDATCCEAPAGVETHYEDVRFYFLNTLQDYHDIMTANGDTSTAIWVTQFGWGTSEDLGLPGENDVFVSYTSLDEQAAYTARALEIGRNLGYVGPMLLFNLNGCQAMGHFGAEGCYYSLFGPDGMPRPSLNAIQSVIGSASVPESPTAEATPELTVEPLPTTTPETTPESTAESTP